MASTRCTDGRSPVYTGSLKRAQKTACLAILIGLVQCSWLIDKDNNQCSQDSDCGNTDGARCDLALKVCRVPPACTLALPPTGPSILNAGDSISLTVAINAIDFGESNEGGRPKYFSIGYDQDSICLDEPQTWTCGPLPWVQRVATQGDGGRDNALGGFVYHQKAGLGQAIVTSEGATALMHDGRCLPMGIIRVNGYSGLPLDDVVRVEWYAPSVLDVDGPSAVPRWDKTDRWLVSSESAAKISLDAGAHDSAFNRDAALDASAETDADSIVPSFVDPTAYVNRYSLVARFPGPIPLVFMGVLSHVSNVTFTAKLEFSQGAYWTLRDGVFSARASAATFFSILPELTQTRVGVPMCKDVADYTKLKTYFCSFMDLLSDGTSDTRRECDAFSIGFGFQTFPVVISGIGPVPERPNPCPTDRLPSEDSCSSPPNSANP